MKKWSSQWTQFMQLHKEAWKKLRTSTGFEPNSDRLSMIYVIQKEVEEQVKNAKSIFEFSAKDIQGNDVSLEKYR